MTPRFLLHARADRFARLLPPVAIASAMWLGVSEASAGGGAAAAPVSARPTSPGAAAPTAAPPAPVAAPPAPVAAPPAPVATSAKTAPAVAAPMATPAATTSNATSIPAAQPKAPAVSTSNSATDGVAAVSPTTPAEKKAAALASEAMNKDFLAMAFESAEKKLRKAIQICLQQSCTVPFRARLNRDIGVVYIVGMNRVEDGKDEFAAALLGDPTVAIAPDMVTDEVAKAFLEVRRGMSNEQPAPASVPAGPAESTDASASVEHDDETSSGETWRKAPNWVSLSIQQDFLLHSATKYVCNDGTQYRCYDGANQLANYTTGHDIASGNELKSTGVKTATMRVLAGYERLFGKNYSIGLKVGMIVSGKAMRLPQDRAVLAFHGEGRFTYYPGSDPFGPSKLLRPYVFLAGGVAEVDGRVTVEVYENLPNQPAPSYARVVAWKRAGRIFVGLGAGAHFALGKNHGPFVELRINRMMEKSSFAGALQAGYAYGF